MADRISGLGGITPPGFGDIESEIGRMADRVSGLGGITPPGFGDIESEIGRMADRVSGLGGITPPGFGDIEDIITQLGLNVRGLPGYADFTPLGEQIAGYGADIAGLGQTAVDWTPIEEQIGGFQTAVEDLGDTDVGDVRPEDDEVPDEVPEEQKDLIEELQKIILDLSGADPMDAAALRADPVNASLLLDLSKRMGVEKGQMIEDMQRLGVLASGETAGELADLSEAEARAISDILSSGAERARADRDIGLARGVDLSGIITDRDLATAELIGRTISGDKTLGGRGADLDVIAAITAVLDPALKLSAGVSRSELANSILETSGWDQETKNSWRKAFGIDPFVVHDDDNGDSTTSGGTGAGGDAGVPEIEGGPTNQKLTVSTDGRIIGGNDPNLNRALEHFFDENPDLAVTGTIYVRDGVLYNSDGKVTARWSTEKSKWEQN
jgi:hypothetical protein